MSQEIHEVSSLYERLRVTAVGAKVFDVFDKVGAIGPWGALTSAYACIGAKNSETKMSSLEIKSEKRITIPINV